MTHGFTLVEVLVATAVLSIGAAALGSIYVNLNNQRRLEIQAVNDYVCGVDLMEQLVSLTPDCRDTLVLYRKGRASRPCPETTVRLRALPGVSHLTLASFSMSRGTTLQRFVPCK